MNQAAQELLFAHAAQNDVTVPLKKLAASVCNHPKKILYRNRFYNTLEPSFQPCGKCDQCRNTKANQMMSRMYLDARILQHAYFVTLTYKSYDNVSDIPKKVASALWHYDRGNRNRRLCWSPCCLDADHPRKWLALLRTNLGNKFGRAPILEYWLAGEYGTSPKDFGRPHWHLIILSDVEITHQDCLDAWSYHKVPFCDPRRLEVDDLFANGTMSGINQKSAKRCFKYVFKYCGKEASSYKFCKYRLNLAISYFRSKQDVKETTALAQTWYFRPSKYQQQRFKNYCRSHFDSVWNYREYLGYLGPLHSCSTGHALGKYWFLENWQTVLDGNKRLYKPIQATAGKKSQRPSNSNGFTLSWPSYYERLLQKIREPLVARGKGISGFTSTKKVSVEDINSLCFCLAPLFDGVPEKSLPYPLPVGCQRYVRYLAEYIEPIIFQDIYTIEKFFGDGRYPNLGPSDAHLYDFSSNSVLMPTLVNCKDVVHLEFTKLRWSRGKRKYEQVGTMYGPQFYKMLLEGFRESQKEFERTAPDRKVSYDALSLCLSREDCFGDLEPPLMREWLNAIEQNKLRWETFRQQKYEEALTKDYVYD